MGKKKMVKRGVFIVCILVVLFVLYVLFFRSPSAVKEPSFEGSSELLAETAVVSALDSPIPGDKNIIWCASFLSAWKDLQENIVKEPLNIAEADEFCRLLNNADNPEKNIPEGSVYSVAGFVKDRIIETIQKNMKQLFPEIPLPVFPNMSSDYLLAYAFLTADIKFSIPYHVNDEPLVFNDGKGIKTKIKSFGVLSKDKNNHDELRDQIRILYKVHGENYSEPEEFAIDLDKNSNQSQIIIACVKPKETLASTVASVEKLIEENKEDAYGLGGTDVLLVPFLLWRITHHYKEIEGKELQNSSIKGYEINPAIQEIRFKLNQYGASVTSWSMIGAKCCAPVFYECNRPFLIYLKKRGAEKPYFAMWVDNAELLCSW